MFQKSFAFAVFISLISTVSLSAQDTTHTLLKFRKPESIGIYIAPEFQYGSLNGDFTSFGGGSLMLMVNNRFAFGITGQSSISNTFSPKNSSPLFVRSQFGGGKIEYAINPYSAIHITLPLVVGVGEVRADSLNSRSGFWGGGERNNYYNRWGNTYVVIQPGVNVEANLFKAMKLFVGANYRFSILEETTTAVLPASALQGLSISAGVKMGIFNFSIKKKEVPVQN